MDIEWQETKKEMGIDPEGKLVVKSVTMEIKREKFLGFEKKELWDLVIKTIGIVAIVTPLLLFKCSRDADVDKQKNIMQLELYSNVLADVQRIILLPDTSAEFKSSKKKLDIEYYSKMMMMGNDSIKNIYNNLKDTINLYALIEDANHLLDTIKKRILKLQYTCNLSTKTLSRQTVNPSNYKDSLLAANAVALEKSCLQWRSRKEVFKSIVDSAARLNNSLNNIMNNINKYVPAMRDNAVKDTLSLANVQAIESLSNDYYRLLAGDIGSMTVFEKEFKERIRVNYKELNRLIIKFNKYLSK